MIVCVISYVHTCVSMSRSEMEYYILAITWKISGHGSPSKHGVYDNGL